MLTFNVIERRVQHQTFPHNFSVFVTMPDLNTLRPGPNGSSIHHRACHRSCGLLSEASASRRTLLASHDSCICKSVHVVLFLIELHDLSRPTLSLPQRGGTHNKNQVPILSALTVQEAFGLAVILNHVAHTGKKHSRLAQVCSLR